MSSGKSILEVPYIYVSKYLCNMIKINSELPLCMLEDNLINEYDFVLFHLYISNDKYREYYLNLRESNPHRTMIFDNSAYEFFVKGEQLDLERFYKAICELKPDMYILPDVLMSMDKTIEGTCYFLDMYEEGIQSVSPNSKPMAVAQGVTEDELIQCLNFYKKMGIDRVAIPFHNKFFKDMGCDVSPEIEEAFCKFHNTTLITEDMRYAMGRVRFMRSHHGIWHLFDHIHMLGSHSVAEKMFYHDFNTMDTGYPVKCAVEGYLIGQEPHKPEVIIDEFLEKDLKENVKNMILTNILVFRGL